MIATQRNTSAAYRENYLITCFVKRLLTIRSIGGLPDEHGPRVAHIGTVDPAPIGDHTCAGGATEAHILNHFKDLVI